jgi:hypothetical protein
MKNLLIIITILSYSAKAKADIFLATHLLLHSFASNYLPESNSSSAHGAYFGMTYGYRYELGDSYKLGGDTEGSEKTSPGLSFGYHFLNSATYKVALTYDRKWSQFQGEDKIEGKDTIDSYGLRLNYSYFAFKFGWSSHKLTESENQHDGGAYTGIGIDFFYGPFSIYIDITSHYLEDRELYIAGGDFGFRYSFGGSETAN